MYNENAAIRHPSCSSVSYAPPKALATLKGLNIMEKMDEIPVRIDRDFTE
jgi:hypothetical protein